MLTLSVRVLLSHRGRVTYEACMVPASFRCCPSAGEGSTEMAPSVHSEMSWTEGSQGVQSVESPTEMALSAHQATPARDPASIPGPRLAGTLRLREGV